mgnify:CR=1 FL=1
MVASFFIYLAIGLAMYLALFLVKALIVYLIKKNSIKHSLNWNSLIQFGVFLVFEIISLVMIVCNYSRTSYQAIIALSLGWGIVNIFVPYWTLVLKIKNKELKTINILKTIGFASAILFMCLEVFCFANRGNGKDQNMQEISLSSPLIVDTNGDRQEDGIVFSEQRQYIILDNASHDFQSFYLDVTSEAKTKLQVDFYYLLNNGKEGYVTSFAFNPLYDDFEYFDISQYDKLVNSDYIKVVFVIDETNLTYYEHVPSIKLTKIAVNKAMPFIFNPIRVCLLIGFTSAVCLLIKHAHNFSNKENDKLAIIERIVLSLAGVILIVTFVISFIEPSRFYVRYDSLNLSESNIYYQLFDAFRKGRLSLDIPVSEGLKNCANPYNPANRNGFQYFWDHAYYNGQYYCYYGASPVILFMFPVYLLSGMNYIPNVLFINIIGVLFASLAFLLALIEVSKVLLKKVNYPFFIFVLVTALFATALVNSVVYRNGYYYEGIYRPAYTYGLTFLFLSLYFLFKAYRNKDRRMLYLSFVGLFTVLMIASRPNLIMTYIMIIPFFVIMLLDKTLSIKKRLLDLVPMVGVLLVGAILICTYNKMRFDSIFEFGQTYQLTVVDNTKLAYSVDGIAPTLMNFFIVPFSINKTGTFPYINFGYFYLENSYHPYNAGCMGILMIPFFWNLLLLPIAFRKGDDWGVRSMMYLSPIVIFMIAFTTYCFAGVCPRYITDLWPVVSFASAIILLKVFDRVPQKGKTAVFGYSFALSIVTIFFMFNLMFNSFDGWGEGDALGLLEIMRSITNNFNM